MCRISSCRGRKMLRPKHNNTNAWVAQLVEHSPEEGRVTSSNLVPSTINKKGLRMEAFLVCYLDFTLTFVLRFLSIFGRRMMMRPFFSVAIVVSGSISSGRIIVLVNDPQ